MIPRHEKSSAIGLTNENSLVNEAKIVTTRRYVKLKWANINKIGQK